MEEKALNQSREEHGLKPIEGGDVAYCSLSELNKKPTYMNAESSLNKILTEYNQQTYQVAKEFIKELKKEVLTYKELDRNFNQLKKSVNYLYGNFEKFSYFFTVVENLIEEEKNNLPLTNNVDEKAVITSDSCEVLIGKYKLEG